MLIYFCTNNSNLLRMSNVKKLEMVPPATFIKVCNSGALNEDKLIEFFGWLDTIIRTDQKRVVVRDIRSQYLAVLPKELAAKARINFERFREPPKEVVELIKSGALEDSFIHSLEEWIEKVSKQRKSDIRDSLGTGVSFDISVARLLDSYASRKYGNRYTIGRAAKAAKWLERKHNIRTVHELMDLRIIDLVPHRHTQFVIDALCFKYGFRIKDIYTSKHITKLEIPVRDLFEQSSLTHQKERK